jgi:hypothetical protein
MLTQKQRLIGNYNDVHAFASAFYPKCLFKMLMIMQTQCCTTTISGSRTHIMHVTNVRFHHKNAPKLYIFLLRRFTYRSGSRGERNIDNSLPFLRFLHPMAAQKSPCFFLEVAILNLTPQRGITQGPSRTFWPEWFVL